MKAEFSQKEVEQIVAAYEQAHCGAVAIVRCAMEKEEPCPPILPVDASVAFQAVLEEDVSMLEFLTGKGFDLTAPVKLGDGEIGSPFYAAVSSGRESSVDYMRTLPGANLVAALPHARGDDLIEKMHEWIAEEQASRPQSEQKLNKGEPAPK